MIITSSARRFAWRSALIAGLSSLAAQAQNLVTNPGFETGDFTGWTLSGNTGFTGVTFEPDFVHTGEFGAFFGPVNTLGFLSQSLATTPGSIYRLDFWLRNFGGTPNAFQLTWNGTIPAGGMLTNASPFGFTRFTFAGLTATAASTPLSFGFRHDPDFWALDTVSVVLTNGGPTPPPPPPPGNPTPDAGSAMGLMAVALGALGAAKRFFG